MHIETNKSDYQQHLTHKKTGVHVVSRKTARHSVIQISGMDQLAFSDSIVKEPFKIKIQGTYHTQD